MQITKIIRSQQQPSFAVTFNVFFQSGEVAHVCASDLLSYRRFQAAVLEQIGQVYRCLWLSKDHPWELEVQRHLFTERTNAAATAAEEGAI